MRARNMQALTDDIVRERPGATVWGKGDRAHQSSPSDHNEDDTPGSKPEQTDADNTPEHRALDIPTLGPITWSYLESLRRRLTERPANQRRLRYAILGQSIWRKRNGWKREDYSGEYHGHLHVSGDAADDENGSRWDLATVAEPVPSKGDDDGMKMIIANLSGHATLWSGLRGVVPMMAHSHEAAVEALDAAGAVRRTFTDAGALVEALGGLEGKTTDEAIKAVQVAG